MAFRNSTARWGWIAQALHWLTALLVIGTATVGLLMDELPNSPWKIEVYGLHKSFGLTILAIVVLRLLWRLIDPRPALPSDMPAWQKGLSSLVHGLLYAALLAMPLTGWLYNSAANFPLRWFGIVRVPALWPADRDVREIAGDAHELIFYVIAALFLVHVAGALKHHFIDRDATLSRMLPGLRSPAPPPSKED